MNFQQIQHSSANACILRYIAREFAPQIAKWAHIYVWNKIAPYCLTEVEFKCSLYFSVIIVYSSVIQVYSHVIIVGMVIVVIVGYGYCRCDYYPC